MRSRWRGAFKPHQSGLRKVFGDLEASIMEFVWRRGPVTVGDAWGAVSKKRDVAYTTVKTVMNRLAQKGYLTKSREERAHTYVAAIGRDEFLRSVGQDVLKGLFVDFGEPVRTHLVAALRKHDLGGIEWLEALIRNEKGRRK